MPIPANRERARGKQAETRHSSYSLCSSFSCLFVQRSRRLRLNLDPFKEVKATVALASTEGPGNIALDDRVRRTAVYCVVGRHLAKGGCGKRQHILNRRLTLRGY